MRAAIDLGSVVRVRFARTSIERDGVVVEVVPPQRFPRRYPDVTRCLDYQTRYVVATDRRLCVRAVDQMEIIAP